LYVLLLILTLDNTVTDVALLTLARDLREHHCAAAVTFPERLPPSVALAREETVRTGGSGHRGSPARPVLTAPAGDVPEQGCHAVCAARRASAELR
jgi:hypothetical protein